MPSSAEMFGASILIVDNQAADVQLLRTMLTKAGYTRIASTLDPFDVCTLHRKHSYDLILLDLLMPGLDGFGVLAGLKEIETQGYLSVLVLTGEPNHMVRALQAGAKDFVSKPFKSIEVLTRIHNLLEVRLLYKEAQRKLRYLECYDPLTGLPNRKLFHESLRRALDQAAQHCWTVSVLAVDIDRFKDINDTLGHALGDELLRLCGDRLRGCLRFSDTLARLGGDEFGLILLTQKKPEECSVVAGKVRDALRQPFRLDGKEVSITASIGVTFYPVDSTDPITLVKNSDAAMHRAKDAGRDTYRFYTPQMNEQTIARLDTEGALRKALANDEFVLHYQPKVRLDTGRISGVEALLRWNRPGCGLISPLDFIPILEETGLIVPVGAWVIRTACQQIAAWRDTGVGSVCIAINLSSRQFSRDSATAQSAPANTLSDIEEQLLEFEIETAQALHAQSIDPTLIEFELTESLLMANADHSVAILKRLRRLGIGLSMDDFGTGFSSLAYLKRFPLDSIKIDRAFIREVTLNADDDAIVLAIIAMAHTLKLKVIAEGVETREQLEFLRGNHCDEGQGYFLSRPIAGSEIATLLRNKVIAL